MSVVSCPDKKGMSVPDDDFRQTLDSEKLTAVKLALLNLPLYVIVVAVMIFYFVPAEMWEQSMKNTWGSKLVLLGLAILCGIAYQSLRCIRWLDKQPFRALAVGRYLYAIFLVCHLPSMLLHWPQQELHVPLAALQEATHPQTGQNVYMISPATCSIAGTMNDQLSFLVEFIPDAVSQVALFFFLAGGYRLLRRRRPPYDFGNFLFDVSFGWIGEDYQWKKYGAGWDPVRIAK